MNGPLKTSVLRPSVSHSIELADEILSERSHYDALADLFLDSAPPIPAREADVSRVSPKPRTELHDSVDQPKLENPSDASEMEGVIVGHLPVLGAAWITQFARHRSTELGAPVALVRLADGILTIDVVADANAKLDGLGEQMDLQSALNEAARATKHWVLRVGEMQEQAMAGHSEVGVVTLLTGADEAAVVASYRTLKGLSRAEQDLRARPQLRLAIFGAEDAQSAEADQRIRRASSSFLGREIQQTAMIRRISACTVANIYRASTASSVVDVMDQIARARNKAKLAITPSPPLNGLHANHPLIGTARSQTPSAHSIPSHAERLPERNTSIELPSSPALNEPTTAISRMLEGQLVELSVRSPYTPGVEFAVDGAGVLQLIAVHDGGSDNGVKALLEAAAWTHAHETLLRAACPELVNGLGGGPQLHLITEQPRYVKRLWDSGIKVHLMVKVGDMKVCRALN